MEEVLVNIEKELYTYDEVYKNSIEYFNGDDLAATTWMNKYAMKNKNGEFIEKTPDDMHKRMAKEFARIENKYNRNLNGESKSLSKYGLERVKLTEEKIYEYFKNFKYIIPQGSVMSCLGNPYILGSLSNCIVLPKIYDSYGGICYTDQQLTHLFKRRCGAGIDISELRPKDTSVSNAAKTTNGATSFMERFSNTTREVAQNGRRGALMITISINHPDVEDFITIKEDLKKVTGANISIRLTDEFMLAVEDDKDFILKFPVDSDTPKITKTIKARKLWDTIIKCAWTSAEPGLMFWDNHINHSTSSQYIDYQDITSNPCSEIIMGNDSCRLVALNMFNCVKNPFTKDAEFDYKKWYEISYEGQRLMDNLVDLELEAVKKILDKIEEDPEPGNIKQIEIDTWKQLYDSGKKGRRTGLGFTALADTLASLNLKYDSKKSLEIIEKIMKTKCEGEFNSSIDMSVERGSFYGWDKDIEEKSGFNKMLKKELPDIYDRMLKYGRRNVSISTVAPTGTVSIMTQTSSGIEPVFMLSYKRRRKINPSEKGSRVDFVDDLGDKWQEFDVYHPKLKMWMDKTGENDIKKSPYYGCTANDIDWIKRVELQSIIQKYVTHSISSTINVPKNISEEKIGEIYMESWKRKLKGITVYRDGCRSGVLISNDEKKDNNKINKNHAPKRPKDLECDIYNVTALGKKWLVIVGLYNGDPYEVFGLKLKKIHIPQTVKKGKLIKIKKGQYDLELDNGFVLEDLTSHFDKDEHETLTRMISTSLRHGCDIKYIVEQLDKSEGTIVSFGKAISRTLRRYIEDKEIKNLEEKCPSCNQENTLIHQEGCVSCSSCNFSKCS